MSTRATKWVLWVTLVFTLPVPYFMIEVGRVPPVRLFLFALLTAAAAIAEPGFDTRFVAGLLVPQALLWGALCYGLARIAAAQLERRLPTRLRAYALAAAVTLLVAGSLLPVFRTPFSHSARHTNLLGIFD